MIFESVEMRQWRKKHDFARRDRQIHIGVLPQGHHQARVMGPMVQKHLFEC